MSKYRIVQTYMNDHSVYYRVDERFWFFLWDKGRHYDTLEQARYAIVNLKHADSKPDDVVLEVS